MIKFKNDLQLITEAKGNIKSSSFRPVYVILVVFSFLLTTICYAQKPQLFSLQLDKVPLKQVFDSIEAHSNYKIMCNDVETNAIKSVTVSLKLGLVDDVLSQALNNSDLAYTINDNVVIVYKKLEQQKPISPTEKVEMFGQVVDANGVAIPGVSVHIKGTTTGVNTDANGKYRITAKGNNKILVFSFIGMQTQEIPIQRGEINVIMIDDEVLISNIVVTGYQKLKVNQAAGSFNTINMKDFEKKIGPSITSTLEGLSPSLLVSSEPGGRKTLTIRGISTLEGSSTPLIVVDGFPYNDDISTINPYDIENITLLKDAASASIYGAKSANGVIVITTKRGKKGNLEIRYMSTTQISQKPDIGYLMNRVSPADMVDIETDYFNNNKDELQSYQWYYSKKPDNANRSIDPYNKTLQYYIARKEGRITEDELNAKLAILRTLDNTKDLEKLLLETPLYSEHNISASYGAKEFKLRTSLNYFSEKTGFRGSKNDGVKYTFNSVIGDVSDKFHLDLLANFNINKGYSYRGGYSDLLNISPYEMIWDKNGKPLPVTKLGENQLRGTNNNGISGGKDAFEIERLKSLGLFDETYVPASDYGLSRNKSTNWGARFQAQMNLKIIKEIEGTVAFNINSAQEYRKL